VDDYTVESVDELGEILLVRFEKETFLISDDWHCESVRVKDSGGKITYFPGYCWLLGDNPTLELRTATGKTFTIIGFETFNQSTFPLGLAQACCAENNVTLILKIRATFYTCEGNFQFCSFWHVL